MRRDDLPMRRKLLVPPMVSELIKNGLLTVEGITFSELALCPHCGGKVQGYDVRKKRFVTFIEGEVKRDIFVYVKRFRCRICGSVCSADAPFYPSTRIGSPVVDFSIVLSKTMPYRRVSRLLAACHIDMDWGTVRNYTTLGIGPVPSFDMYGLPIPLSLVYLSILGMQVSKGGSIVGAEALAACRPPAADGTFFRQAGFLKEWDERDEKKQKEKR